MSPKFIKGIVAILKGKTSPTATAFGIALGAALGLIPKDNMLPFLFFILFFLTTIDKPAAIVASIFFTPIGFALDGAAHKIGLLLLVKSLGLKDFWTSLYNMPLIPWTKFNNTAVLGHLLIGAILFLPLFFVSKALVTYYQKNIKSKVEKFKVIQSLKALRAYQWWDSIDQQ